MTSTFDINYVEGVIKMIVNARNCWVNGVKEHTEYFDEVTKKPLEDSFGKIDGAVHSFIKINLTNIRDGNHNKFKKLIKEFNNLTSKMHAAEKNKTLNELASIFDYEYFSRKRVNSWCAYKLCKASTIKTCPYCNLSFAHTIFRDNQGEIRPTLDHYFDKARYPFLAISINNLIPSCHICNSSLKGTSDFYGTPHLHPLFDDESIDFFLDCDLKSTWDVREIYKSHIKLSAKGKPAIKSAETFLLEERYQAIEEEAQHIAEGLIISRNNPNRRDWILRGTNDTNYKDRIMGKMIIDLKKQFP